MQREDGHRENVRTSERNRPCSDLPDKRFAGGGCKDIMSHGGHLHSERGRRGAGMRPSRRNGTGSRKSKDHLKPRTAQPERSEEHEATHAQHRSWCISCARGRGIAMKQQRSIGAGGDEGKLHTFVMDYCFPSQGSQPGTTVLVIKETKTKAISTFMVQNKGANECFVEAVVDFMSGCGCGHAILNSDFERAIVAVQDAVKNAT